MKKENLKINFKALNNKAVLPSYAKEGDGALDITATSINYGVGNFVEYGTSLAVEIPDGYFGLLLPRSSITNKGLMLKNSLGLIDSGYRNELKFRFQELSEEPKTHYEIGDRIGQLLILPYPILEPMFVENLSESKRNLDGWGSSGS